MIASTVRTELELADVVRRHLSNLTRWFPRLPAHKMRALYDIATCRTAVLGGHRQVCAECGTQQQAYNSCRNRHCPKCLGSDRHRWTKAREAELLPVPYFHVVFTVPHSLGPLFLQNPRLAYNLLFQAAAETLKQVAADPRHLGARIGFLSVLHTWGQKLDFHPHIHSIVPAGGIAPNGQEWIHGRPDYLLPVRVLSAVFSAKLRDHLYRAYARGDLQLHGQLKSYRSPRRFKTYLAATKSTDWVVYSKRPFGGPRQVIRYLATYTHRVAFTNRRLQALDDDRVTFSYKDYADGARRKSMSLTAREFIRRFLMHILPKGFMRIRYYGFMANAGRAKYLAKCRELLADTELELLAAALPVPTDSDPDSPSSDPVLRCPACGSPHVVIRDIAARKFITPQRLYTPTAWDTS